MIIYNYIPIKKLPPRRTMFLKSILNTFLISYLIQNVDSKSYDINNDEMTIFGSGCPEGSVSVISSTDGSIVTVLFSGYYAETDGSDTFDRKSCNLAVPFDIDPNKQISLYQIDYRGYTWVPENEGSKTTFQVEYFFAGLKGPIVKKTYTKEENIVITNMVPLMASPCGGKEIFRINTSIVAKKGDANDDETFITIDSVDGTEDNSIALMYYFEEQDC